MVCSSCYNTYKLNASSNEIDQNSTAFITVAFLDATQRLVNF
jgi:hypothetical protein